MDARYWYSLVSLYFTLLAWTDKKKKITYLIDISIPNDLNIQAKYNEKIAKYTDLAIEMLWKQARVEIIPLVMNREVIHRKKPAAAIALVIACGYFLTKPEISRRWWVRPWLEDKTEGALNLVKRDFPQVPEQFKQFSRLSKANFEKLLLLVTPKIEKKNTTFRNAISSRDKLFVTLRFLATGESYRSLMYSFRIAESTISLFIPVVCRAIYDVLKEKYLKTLTTVADWLMISKEFQTKWDIPNTIGVLDGKHIVFRAPRAAGSKYYNYYKQTNSIVLLALVDAKDGGVFRQSTLSRAIAQNYLNIPENKSLPGRQKPVPCVILGDAAFPLSEHILKPNSLRNITREERIFNYRLSRGRMIIECTFGMLANRFRVFLTTINLSAEKYRL
ncbi:hypothetical protein NQ315_012890 [Exocentrus adspersus]|uniref:DDE Tnp4 domain-containing protein n=1 Tax=Exocentrus adspersus TaxID=1586481 RepID=A0AAV8VGS6_9CUCU|nr:hypothetical protein NQ315_012890 [Exocentrus adspersus]